MIEGNSEKVVRNIFKSFERKIEDRDFVQGTVELMDAKLVLDPRDSELSYGDIRPFNKKYAIQEEDWYMSLDRCIKGHDGIENNKTWSRIASDKGFVNSNYGYLVYAKRTAGKSQYEYALNSLKESYDGVNSGRQSVIYYAGPDMQVNWNDNIHAKHDFTCTFETQYFIRKNKLYYIVYQRSSDSIFGLTYDFHHHCNVYKKFYKDLRKSGIKVKIGKIIMNFGSLHLYERHFDLIKKICEEYDYEQLDKAVIE